MLVDWTGIQHNLQYSTKHTWSHPSFVYCCCCCCWCACIIFFSSVDRCLSLLHWIVASLFSSYSSCSPVSQIRSVWLSVLSSLILFVYTIVYILIIILIVRNKTRQLFVQFVAVKWPKPLSLSLYLCFLWPPPSPHTIHSLPLFCILSSIPFSHNSRKLTMIIAV